MITKPTIQPTNLLALGDFDLGPLHLASASRPSLVGGIETKIDGISQEKRGYSQEVA
jgi:hypothetical protein